MSKKPAIWFHKSTGYYCIKYKGKRHYLSKDQGEAEKRYAELIESLDAQDQVEAQDVTMHTLLNAYMEHQAARRKSDEIREQTFTSMYTNCRRCLQYFRRNTLVSSITPKQFTAFNAWLGEEFALTTRYITIKELRAALKFGVRNRYLPEMPETGECKLPSARVMRRNARDRGKDRVVSQKLFGAILDECKPFERPLVLLGLNTGMGPADWAEFKWEHIDGHWVDFNRVKTGERRVGWLWDETLASLPARTSEYVFPKANGERRTASSLRQRVVILLDRAGIAHRPTDFRHTMATIGNQSGDPDAVRAMMGHVDQTLLSNYVHQEAVHDMVKERVKAVSMFVRDWAFGAEVKVAKPTLRVVG